MTTIVDVANRAIQAIGIQKRISSLSQDSAEAQAVASIYGELRDDLLRMAPWTFAMRTANLSLITSVPGTPENTSAATTLWQPGQPTPPWAYEYQYPVDCLRTCWMIPATQTGFAGGVPITTAVTGGAPSFWQGPPVKFQVQSDLFYPVTAASPVAGGVGYAIGETLTLAGNALGTAPIGAPAQLSVATLSGSAVASVAVVNQVQGSAPALGGSYFSPQPNPVAQGSSSGSGSGATFNLTFGPQAPQRVILTNQEFAILTYVQQVTDPNAMDTLFLRAWINILAANLAMTLLSDKPLANMRTLQANSAIESARVANGNEGFTVNDVTPDWIRARGVEWTDPYGSPFDGFDWGSSFPVFG
jgi:hypothetical protein